MTTSSRPQRTAGRPPRVLVLTPGPPEDLVAALDTALGGDWELVTPGPDADHEALHGLLAEVDVVLGDWSGRWRLSAAEAAVARRVRLVQQPGVGVEFIDPAAWAVHGIPVANAAGTNATAVAEWCVAAVLVLLRSMCWADAAVRGGRWPSAAETLPRVRELRGLRVGLIGLGPIGAACAQRLRTFDCALSYWSRTRRRPDDEHGATYRELDDLVATSDVLVVAVALTEQTRGLVGQERLARLPTGAVVVNVARGAVVDEVALARGLQEGRLGGAALDVFATEPLPADSPLRDAPNVLFSPHVGGATAPARERTLAAAAGNVSRAVRGEPLMSVLNGIGSSVPTLPPAGSPAENRSAS